MIKFSKGYNYKQISFAEIFSEIAKNKPKETVVKFSSVYESNT